MFSGYRTLMSTPGAMRFSIPGVIARMPISMDSLALIFIVVAVSDSYALAGRSVQRHQFLWLLQHLIGRV